MQNSFVDGPFGSDLKVEHYTDKQEVRVIQLNNIGDGYWKNNGKKYTTYEHTENLARCKTFPGDIIIAKMMPAGRCAIVPETEKQYIISSDCVKLTLHNLVNTNFIVNSINSSSIRKLIQDDTQGIGRSRTSLGKLKELLIPLPPQLEQKRITDTVEELLKLVDKIEQDKLDLKDLVKQTKAKVLDLAIKGKLVPQDDNDEPADKLLEKIREEKEKLIKEGKLKRDKNESYIYKNSADNSYYEKIGDKVKCIDDDLPFEIPDSWRWQKFGAVCKIERGGSPRPIEKYITNSENGINWIKIGDTEKGGKYICSTKEKIIPEGISKSRYVKAGDFLLTNSMSFGRPYILKIDGCIHDGWLVINDNYCLFNQDFLYYLLSSNAMYQLLTIAAKGSTVKNLKSDTVKMVNVPIPPQKEQQKIVQKIEEIFLQLDNILSNLQ